MRSKIYSTVFALLFIPTTLSAESPTAMREDRDGIVEADEYTVISMNGGTTRRPCPYTCEMRGLPRNQCREWRSLDGVNCYVLDTTKPNNAMPENTQEERARYDSEYKD